jgi:hypothetical protein
MDRSCVRPLWRRWQFYHRELPHHGGSRGWKLHLRHILRICGRSAFLVATIKITYGLQGNTFAIASEVVPRRYRGVAQIINAIGGNTGNIL